MPVIKLETWIANAPEVIFDLSRDIDLHQKSMVDSSEKVVAGRTSGLIELGESVTWQATHFGISQQLTSKITAFNRPKHFRDSMVKGAFKRFDHDHYFEASEGGTLMSDVFDYSSPLGLLGVIADKLFLYRYMEKLLSARNIVIKEVAESQIG